MASWQETGAGVDGLRFGGLLENPTDNFAVLVTVKATLSDADGNVLDTSEGTMRAASVGPHATERFEVAFPNTFAYSNVEFDVSYKFLKGAGDDASASENDPDPPEGTSSDEGSQSESLQPNVG